MAGVVITDAQFSINAVDLTAHVQSVEITETYEEKDTTNMSSGARRERAAGLADGQFSVTLFQNWASSSVNATISPLIGTSVAVLVKADDASTSATNPQYSFNVLVTEWTPISAAVGEVSMATVTWPIDGTITEITS